MNVRLISIIIGFFTGFSSGLLGIGGGVLLVPLSMLFLHIDQRKAQGLSLLNMVFCTPVGALIYFISKSAHVDLVTVLLISVGAIFGARHGAMLAQIASDKILRRLFALLLTVTGLRMLWKTYRAATANGVPADKPAWLESVPAWVLLPIKLGGGYIVGIIAGFFGIGGGVLYVVLLQLALGYDAYAARGMSLAIIVPTAIFAAQVYAKKGNLPTELAPPVIGGAVPGILAGSLLALKMSSTVLNAIFGVFLIVIAVRLALRGVKRVVKKLKNH